MSPLRKAGLGAAILLFLGCGGNEGGESPLGAACPTTGVDGSVTVAGSGVVAELRARSISTGHDGVSAQVQSDSSGKFFLPLTPGEYFLTASSDAIGPYSVDWSVGSPSGIGAERDTIAVVEGQGFRADFAFGAIEFRLGFSEEMVDRGAKVMLWPASSRDIGETWSRAAETAHFLIKPGVMTLISEGMVAGSYIAGVSFDDLPDPVYLPGVLDPSRADTITVPGAGLKVFEQQVSFTAPQTQVRGSVRGSWQRLPGQFAPQVWILTSDSTVAVVGTVAADGSYLLNVPGTTSCRVAVRWRDIVQWIGGATFAEATTFSLTPGVVTAIPPYVESGLLVHLVLPTAWTAASYDLTLVNAAGRRFSVRAPDSMSESVPVSNLAPGAYRLFIGPSTLGASDCLGQWYDGAESEIDATLIQVPAGGEVGAVTVRLVRGGVIRARVRRVDGRESRGYFILTGTGSPGCLSGRYDTESMDVEIRGLPDGDYKLGATDGYPYRLCDEFQPNRWTWYGGPSWDSAAVIAIRDHSTVEGLEILLP